MSKENSMKDVLDVEEIVEQIMKCGAYVARDQVSTCNVCRQKKDLRMGVCFECSGIGGQDGRED